MGIQARMSKEDPRLYSPGRDVAHNFGPLMMEVADRLEGKKWQPLVDLATEKGVSEEELGRTIQGLLLFVESHIDHKKESMANGLARSGFLDRQDYAKVIVMAQLGVVMLGVHWAGVREATLGGVGPADNYKGLRWYGRRSALLMKMPLWHRRLHKLKARLRRIWLAFRGEPNA